EIGRVSKMISSKLGLLLQIFVIVQSRNYTYITLDLDFGNSGIKFKALYEEFVKVQSKPRENPEENVDSYIVPAENLTLYAHEFRLQEGAAPRLPALLRTLSKELCRFKPNRMPTNTRICYDCHSKQLARVFIYKHPILAGVWSDVLHRHGFLDDLQNFDGQFVEFANLPNGLNFTHSPDMDLPRWVPIHQKMEYSFIQFKSVSIVSCSYNENVLRSWKKFATKTDGVQLTPATRRKHD
ncbi:hypothetical protein PMAYCL1PPCAC_26234, partial [Pristionchus mayeri]